MYRSVLALLFASVLLLAYFYVIDPTVQNRQGNDRGSQYQTGVYYTNESARETVKRIAEIERGRSEKFFVEIGPLKNFYPAEEYHQNYLEKNPNGYCHIPRAEMELFSRLRIDPGDYQKPAAESIRDKLTAEQYRVTQESGTERAFTGEFWDKFEKGIYVDVVTVICTPNTGHPVLGVFLCDTVMNTKGCVLNCINKENGQKHPQA